MKDGNRKTAEREFRRYAPHVWKELLELYDTHPEALRYGLSKMTTFLDTRRASGVIAFAKEYADDPEMVKRMEATLGYSSGLSLFYRHVAQRQIPLEFIDLLAGIAEESGDRDDYWEFSYGIERVWALYQAHPAQTEVFMRLKAAEKPDRRLSIIYLGSFLKTIDKEYLRHIPWEAVLERQRNGEVVSINDLSEFGKQLQPLGQTFYVKVAVRITGSCDLWHPVSRFFGATLVRLSKAL